MIQPTLIRFAHPEYLWALLGVPLMVLAWWLLRYWRKQSLRKLGDPMLVRQLMNEASPRRQFLKSLYVVFAYALLVVGAANPQSPDTVQVPKKQGVDVMLVWDLSRSMLATDIQPNRLEKSRLLLLQLAERLQNNRVGLVVFAGHAYLQMPLTSDLASARLYLQTVNLESVPTQGTVISEALQVAQEAFPPREKKYKAIVLITDGEDHDQQAVETARALSENGVIIHTVGAGSAQGSTLPGALPGEVKKDPQGNVVVSRLNESALREIARAGKGQYYWLGNPKQQADQISTEIARMQTTEIVDLSAMQFLSYFPWLLAPALLILILEFLLPTHKKKWFA